MFGVIVSKCIITGNIMADLFEGVQILDNYYTWLGILFGISAILSFRDLTNMKIMQNFIGFIRFLVIILFIVVPVYHIVFAKEKTEKITEFNWKYNEKEYNY